MLDKPISPLRQRMIDDMTARRFNEHTQMDLRPARQELGGFSRSFSGCRHERGRSPISIADGEGAERQGGSRKAAAAEVATATPEREPCATDDSNRAPSLPRVSTDARPQRGLH